MKFILGKKLEMTQIFKADGQVVPVTKVQAGPCFITQIRTKKDDKYTAIQIGLGEKKKIGKCLTGHLKDLPKVKEIKEFRVPEDQTAKLQKGLQITTAVFAVGDTVEVEGVSKGKGFAGVVKRHHFHGHPESHGHKDQLRRSGSIGQGGKSHVFKNLRMAGRMGGDQVTVRNLEVVEVDNANNLLYIKGAVPGGRNGLLLISGAGEMNLTKPVEEVKEIKAETVAATPSAPVTEPVAPAAEA